MKAGAALWPPLRCLAHVSPESKSKAGGTPQRAVELLLRASGRHAYLMTGDFLVVRLWGVLTAPERLQAKSSPPGIGRDLLKHGGAHLIETAKPLTVRLLSVALLGESARISG